MSTRSSQHSPQTLPSLYFWLAVLGSLGMVAIGGRGLADRLGSAAAYGVPVPTLDAASAWVMAAGVRDLSLGLLGLVFALLKERHALGLLALVGTLIPIADGLIVVTNGPSALPYVLLHWGSAVACLVYAVLLLRTAAASAPRTS